MRLFVTLFSFLSVAPLVAQAQVGPGVPICPGGVTNSGTSGYVLSFSTNGSCTWVAAAAGGVTAVTATAPMASSGGSTPNVSLNNYVAGGGTANAQTATYSPAIGSLVAGLYLCWLPTAANSTTTPTFSPNGLTAKTIVKTGGAALIASDITTTAVACAVYDGTDWELQNPQTLLAPLASPAFTGTPTAPTPSTSDNSTKIATTAYVKAQTAGSTISTGTYASLPSSVPASGSAYFCTDCPYSFISNGSSWLPFLSTYPQSVTGVPPACSNWTWDNQGSSTCDNTYGALYANFLSTSGSNYLRMLYQAAPATPWTHTFLVRADLSGANSAATSTVFWGAGWRDGTGKIVAVCLGITSGDSGYLGQYYTNSTTYGSAPLIVRTGNLNQSIGPTLAQTIYLQIGDNGTNLTASYSIDGHNFIQIWSVSRTAFLTSGPTQFGFLAGPDSNNVAVQVLSFE
jgi:hypothetical protein